jgi:hypothetical protein
MNILRSRRLMPPGIIVLFGRLDVKAIGVFVLIAFRGW